MCQLLLGRGIWAEGDANAGFSLGFISDLEMAGCSALVFVQTSPCQAPPVAAPRWQLPLYLGLMPSALCFCYSKHKDICQEISWSFYSQAWSFHGEISQQGFPLQSRAYPLLAKTRCSLGCEEVSLSKIYSGF